MRIVYYTKTSFGDTDYSLVKALREQGHEVYMIVRVMPFLLKSTVYNIHEQYHQDGIFPASIYPELGVFKQYIDESHLFVSNFTVKHHGIKGLIQSFRELLFIRRLKPDVIHYVEDLSLYHTFTFWTFRKKLCVTIHDAAPHTGESSRMDRFIRKIYTRYVRKFILLNKNDIDVFRKEYCVRLDKISVSHIGYIDIMRSFGDMSVTQSDMLLFFGRISPYKGLEYLLEAMKTVHRKHPEARLVIAGKPNYNIDWVDYRNLDYVEIRDRFIGLDELADLIRAARFVVCPYTDATQSGVVNSAFAFNKPVIASNVGGLPEMIDDGRTGILVPPKDVDALAGAINRYLDRPELLERHSSNIEKNGRIGKGSWKKVAEEYISIYKAENHG